MSTHATLEVPVDSVESARLVVNTADRVEVCSDLATEGWTPEPHVLQEVVALARTTGTEVVAMIRPRIDGMPVGTCVSNFVVTPEIIEVSLAAIVSSANAGADAVAIGPLMTDGQVDRGACSAYVECAQKHGLDVSFLRSIDHVPDRGDAIRMLSEIGVVRILTACVRGWDVDVREDVRAAVLADDVEEARVAGRALGRPPITIMPGGGIRAGNVRSFLAHATNIHSSCRSGGSVDPAELKELGAVVHASGVGLKEYS